MIETTLGQLAEAEIALRRVSEMELNAKTKYHVAKLMRLVTTETKHFYEERQKIHDELGVERDAVSAQERAQLGPRVREIVPAKLSEFHQRIRALVTVPVTIDWTPIRSADIEHAARAVDMFDLGPLCELTEPVES